MPLAYDKPALPPSVPLFAIPSALGSPATPPPPRVLVLVLVSRVRSVHTTHYTLQRRAVKQCQTVIYNY
eukprot:scaffold163221_cov31-Tisochrysis_lutea.AAC.3